MSKILDENGLARFSKDVKEWSSGRFLQDAPSDGREYVRKDGAWQKLFAGKTTFEDVQLLCRAGKAKDVLEIGQPFTFKRDDVNIECLVMGFIEDNKTGSIKIKDNTLQEGVIFQTKDCLYSLQFDEREALYYAPDGLSAGDYSFVLGAHSWYAADVGKTFYFTLQNDVPAGGQLVWKQGYNATLDGGGIDVFDSGNDFTANETATMSSTEIVGATSLGTIKNSFEGNFNSCQRALLGNNRWKESAMRQHLNSNAVAGSVWTPQNHWDRPPSWRTSTKGFMNGLTATLTNYIAEVEIDTYRNTVCDGGGLDTTEDKIFLVGRNELFMPTEGADNGVAWDYYKDNSISSVPHTAADPIRVKGINGGAGTYWWERSPNVGYASFVRGVYPDGSYDNLGAYYSYGTAPAFVIA